MPPTEPSSEAIGRRDAIAIILASGAALTVGHSDALAQQPNRRTGTMITCVIRYQIDPFQRDGFKKHAENLITIIPRCGGHLIGYFLPYEGTNDVAWGLIAFDSLASYEKYKARLKTDAKFRDDTAMMTAKRIIIREERNFVELVDGTFNLPSKL